MVKINIRLIVCQSIGLFLLLTGVLKLRIVSVFDDFVCAFRYSDSLNSACWTREGSMADFLTQLLWWRVYGFALGILIISIRNWKVDVNYVNTIIASIVVLILFPIKFFDSLFAEILFNPLRLTEMNFIYFLITGIIYTFGGVFLIFKAK